MLWSSRPRASRRVSCSGEYTNAMHSPEFNLSGVNSCSHEPKPLRTRRRLTPFTYNTPSFALGCRTCPPRLQYPHTAPKPGRPPATCGIVAAVGAMAEASAAAPRYYPTRLTPCLSTEALPSTLAQTTSRLSHLRNIRKPLSLWKPREPQTLTLCRP